MKSFFFRGFSYAKSQFHFSRKMQLFTLFACNKVIQSINCNDESSEAKQVEGARRAAMVHQLNASMTRYDVCSSQEIQEQQIYPFTIKNGDDDYRILIVRVNNRLYATSSLCTYDLETDLSQGIVFGNKLYCPKHGCQYDITNGFAEQAPAIDYLPKFLVEEKLNKVSVYAPSRVPKKVLPFMYFRDHNDIRKVVVIGGGMAGYAAAQTLREMTFAGQVVIVTKDIHLPYDKAKLTKKIKDTQPQDFYIRNEEWYMQQGIDIINGREVTTIHNKYQNNYVELDDGMRFEYDGVLVATGAFQVHRDIPGLKEVKNIHYLDSIQGHQSFKQAMDITSKLAVFGLNWESIETVSTIRKEYPNVDVVVIDTNSKNFIQTYFGDQVQDQILKIHQKNNVKCYTNANVKEIVQTDDNRNDIIFRNGSKINVDTLLMFPNTTIANTQFLQEYFENIEYDQVGRIKVDILQRTDVKRIFAAGRCSSTSYFVNGDRYPCRDSSAAFQQGLTAAYNIMAMDIPWHFIPFRHVEFYDKTLQRAGYWPKFDQIHMVGDVANWDFVIYYGWNDFIVGALGTPSQKHEISIINEALRLQRAPMLSEVADGRVTMENLTKYIRGQNRSGCYKGLVMNEKDTPVEKSLIWQYREDWAIYPSKTYDKSWSTEFKNFNEGTDAL